MSDFIFILLGYNFTIFSDFLLFGQTTDFYHRVPTVHLLNIYEKEFSHAFNGMFQNRPGLKTSLTNLTTSPKLIQMTFKETKSRCK